MANSTLTCGEKASVSAHVSRDQRGSNISGCRDEIRLLIAFLDVDWSGFDWSAIPRVSETPPWLSKDESGFWISDLGILLILSLVCVGIFGLQIFQLTQLQHLLKNVFCIHLEGFKFQLNKLQDKVKFLSTWISVVSLVCCLPSALTFNTFYYFFPQDSFSLVSYPAFHFLSLSFCFWCLLSKHQILPELWPHLWPSQWATFISRKISALCVSSVTDEHFHSWFRSKRSRGGGAFAATLTLTHRSIHHFRLNMALLFLCEELTGEYLKHASTPPTSTVCLNTSGPESVKGPR